MSDNAVGQRRRGRKPVSVADRRDIQVGVKLTKAEADRVDRLRAKVSRAVFVRKAALKGVRVQPAVNEDLLVELRRLANNTNQIAQGLNWICRQPGLNPAANDYLKRLSENQQELQVAISELGRLLGGVRSDEG